MRDVEPLEALEKHGAGAGEVVDEFAVEVRDGDSLAERQIQGMVDGVRFRGVREGRMLQGGKVPAGSRRARIHSGAAGGVSEKTRRDRRDFLVHGRSSFNSSAWS